jgi:hypothetical protein
MDAAASETTHIHSQISMSRRLLKHMFCFPTKETPSSAIIKKHIAADADPSECFNVGLRKKGNARWKSEYQVE